MSLPRIEKREAFFFLSYGMMLLYMILSNTFYLKYINTMWKPVFFGCLGLLAVHEVISNQVSLKTILQVAAAFGLFVLLLRVVGGYAQSSIAWLPVYMFCARKITFRKIAAFTYIADSLLLLFVVFSSYAGIIQNYIFSGARRRECLGFLYPLYAPSLFSNITLLWIYLRKDRMKGIGVMVFLALNFILFRKTDARLCFYLTALMLCAAWFLKKKRQFVLKRKTLCRLMVLIFVLTFAASVLLAVYYSPSVGWMASLNKMLGRRISLAKESLTQFGANLFGIKGIQWTGHALDMNGNLSNDTYLYVDNYYIQIMQRYGIIFIIAVVVLLTYAAYRCYQKKDLHMLFIFGILAAHFMIDNLYMYIHYNTFWFAAGILLLGSEENSLPDFSALDLTDGKTLLDSVQTILPAQHARTRLTFGKERAK